MPGYVFAFLSSLFFSFYLIPRKFSKQNPVLYTLFMGVGLLAVAALYYIIDGAPTLTNPALVWSGASGILFGAGSIFFTRAIDLIGMSRANQWKNLQLAFSVAVNLWLLHEFSATNAAFVIAACAAVLVSAMLLTVGDKTTKKTKIAGVVAAVASALFFGLNASAQKYAVMLGAPISAQLVCIAASMILMCAVYCASALSKQNYSPLTRNNAWAMLAGGLYFLLALFLMLSYKYISGSAAFTIAQLNAVWTILIGIFVFREINFRKHAARIISGIIFATLGVAALAFA